MAGPTPRSRLSPRSSPTLICDVRDAVAVRGTVRFGPSPAEEASLAFRRSLYVVADVEAGDELTRENVRAIRPGGGLSPKRLDEVLGRRATRAVPRGTPVTDDLLS